MNILKLQVNNMPDIYELQSEVIRDLLEENRILYNEIMQFRAISYEESKSRENLKERAVQTGA